MKKVNIENLREHQRQTMKNVLDFIDKTLDSVRKPLASIPAYFVYVTGIQRKGISKKKVTAEIIADNEPLGINTGQMPDGTDNVVNAFVANVVEKVVDEIKMNAKVECSIPPGSVVISAQGENVGGPLVAVGTNINYGKGTAFIR